MGASAAMISLEVLELPQLPVARSSHEFLQVHIDLLARRVLLVPTFKTATAETAGRNLVAFVFCDVRLHDVLVSNPATLTSPAPCGRACTRRWAHRSSAARCTIIAPPARSKALTASLMMLRSFCLRARRRLAGPCTASRVRDQWLVSNEVLLDTESTLLPSRSLLSPPQMGPFHVLARTVPRTRSTYSRFWVSFPS